MNLGPTYKIEIGPGAVSVEEYAASTEAQFLQLLNRNPREQEHKFTGTLSSECALDHCEPPDK